MAEGLRLRAADADDLKVISAIVQDAIIPICDVAFLPEERRFVAIANRFRWEGGAEPRPAEDGFTPDVESAFERTNCALRFQQVDRVSYRNLDLRDRTQMLSLLAIEMVEDGVVLHLAGGSDIKLHAPAVECYLEDLGEPWPTTLRPCHDGGEVGQAAQ